MCMKKLHEPSRFHWWFYQLCSPYFSVSVFLFPGKRSRCLTKKIHVDTASMATWRRGKWKSHPFFTSVDIWTFITSSKLVTYKLKRMQLNSFCKRSPFCDTRFRSEKMLSLKLPIGCWFSVSGVDTNKKTCVFTSGIRRLLIKFKRQHL